MFDGWNPEVAETVTEDVTYTAQWKPVQPDKKAIENAIGRGVAVVCDNQNVNHGEKKYKPTLGEYTVSDVMAPPPMATPAPLPSGQPSSSRSTAPIWATRFIR